MLGAAKLRDIGFHFPDTSSDFKNVDSKILLRKCLDLIGEKGYFVGNIDATIAAQRVITSYSIHYTKLYEGPANCA